MVTTPNLITWLVTCMVLLCSSAPTNRASAAIWPIPINNANEISATVLPMTVIMNVSNLSLVSRMKQRFRKYHRTINCPNVVRKSTVRTVITIFFLDCVVDAGSPINTPSYSKLFFMACIIRTIHPDCNCIKSKISTWITVNYEWRHLICHLPKRNTNRSVEFKFPLMRDFWNGMGKWAAISEDDMLSSGVVWLDDF